MIPSAVDLSSVNLKLSRAEEHFQALKSEIFAYFHHGPYRYAERVSDDFTKYSIVVTRSECEPPIERWGLMTGDCVHNLRCALDHLIYAIAVFKHGDPPPDADSLAFPIALKPNAFSSYRGKLSMGTLDNAVWTCLEGLQPDIRNNPDLPAFLEIISVLDNRDKHRLVQLTIASPEEYDIGFDFTGVMPGSKYIDEVYYGDLHNGTEVHSITFECPTRNVKYDRVNLHMAFSVWHGAKIPDDPHPWKHRSNVLALLEKLLGEVRAIIPIVLASIPNQ